MPPWQRATALLEPGKKWVPNGGYRRFGIGYGMLMAPPSESSQPTLVDSVSSGQSSAATKTAVIPAGTQGGDYIYAFLASSSSGASSPGAVPNAFGQGFTQQGDFVSGVSSTGRCGAGALYLKVAAGAVGVASSDAGVTLSSTWTSLPPNPMQALYIVVIRGGTNELHRLEQFNVQGDPYTHQAGYTNHAPALRLVFASSGIGGQFSSLIAWDQLTNLEQDGASNGAFGCAYSEHADIGPIPAAGMDRNANNSNGSWAGFQVILESEVP